MWVEKNGKTWRIRDEVGGRKVDLQTGFPSKTAAKAAMVQHKADSLRGQALVPRGGEVLLSEFLDAWQPAWEASLKPSARHSEVGRVRNHIRPLLGHLALRDIDPLTVQRWTAALLAGEGPMADPIRRRRKLSAKTIRNCHGLLFKVMKAAVRQKLIAANPCTDTTLPERLHREMRFLTEPEIGRLVAAMPAHWRPLVLLLVSTGLRWGEAIGVRVANVDLLATPPRLTVLEQLQELASTGELVSVSPKSAMSRRTVTFTPKVADGLAGLVAVRNRRERVFLTATGMEVRTRNFRRIWVKALAAAGLEGLRIHDLRHTHAAMLISAGVPLTAIQRRLGHSSIAVTSDLYGHLLPQVDEGILAAVEAALAQVDAETLAAEFEAELADLS